MTPTLAETTETTATTEPVGPTSLEVAQESLRGHRPDLDPSALTVSEVEGVHVFTGPNGRAYMIQGRCFAEHTADPDTIREAVSWIR